MLNNFYQLIFNLKFQTNRRAQVTQWRRPSYFFLLLLFQSLNHTKFQTISTSRQQAHHTHTGRLGLGLDGGWGDNDDRLRWMLSFKYDETSSQNFHLFPPLSPPESDPSTSYRPSLYVIRFIVRAISLGSDDSTCLQFGVLVGKTEVICDLGCQRRRCSVLFELKDSNVIIHTMVH